jgi:hypothetical protein
LIVDHRQRGVDYGQKKAYDPAKVPWNRTEVQWEAVFDSKAATLVRLLFSSSSSSSSSSSGSGHQCTSVYCGPGPSSAEILWNIAKLQEH